MIDLSFWELMIVGVVALLVIGPKDLPNALRHLGRLTGKARAMTRHVRSGFDEMVRQAEMEEMEKQWREQNAKIMAEHPVHPDQPVEEGSANSILPPAEHPAAAADSDDELYTRPADPQPVPQTAPETAPAAAREADGQVVADQAPEQRPQR